MGISNNQEFWVAGARFYFKRNSDGSTHFPLLDLGTVKPGGVTPNLEVTKAELKDSAGGVVLLAEETVTEVVEEWQVTLANLNNENLAMAFLGERPATVNISATPVTGVTQLAADCHAGYLFQIRDADGNPVYGLASVDGVDVGSVTMVEDTDYEVVDLTKGLIRIIDGAGINDGDVLTVDYTFVARTGRRLIRPQAASTIQGVGQLFFGRENHARVHVRRASMSLSPAGLNMPEGDYADFVLSAKVLGDITDVTEPAGILEHIKGSLPSDS